MPVNPQEMFSPELVTDLQPGPKEQVLRDLAKVLARSPKVRDAKELTEKILERERALSTGVGIGVALPHVKIASITDFVIAVGRCPEGIDFQAIDDQPVRIIVMIGCHASQSGDYLKVLSSLVRALKSPGFREEVLSAGKGETVVDLFLQQFGVPAR